MREEHLCHEALALPPAERIAFLERVCVGQPALRAAVEALLQAHATADHVPDPPTGDGGSTGPYTPPPASAQQLGPDCLFAGRYKLGEKLGLGGMGVVYVADQIEPVQRRVALKVIKTGLSSHEMVARFEQERQALALMDHPHIADGLPYFWSTGCSSSRGKMRRGHGGIWLGEHFALSNP